MNALTPLCHAWKVATKPLPKSAGLPELTFSGTTYHATICEPIQMAGPTRYSTMLLGICSVLVQVLMLTFRNAGVVYLEKHNAQRQELLSHVELILRDADVPEKEVSQCIATDLC